MKKITFSEVIFVSWWDLGFFFSVFQSKILFIQINIFYFCLHTIFVLRVVVRKEYVRTPGMIHWQNSVGLGLWTLKWKTSFIALFTSSFDHSWDHWAGANNPFFNYIVCATPGLHTAFEFRITFPRLVASQGYRTRFVLLFIHSWREKRIYSFPDGIST